MGLEELILTTERKRARIEGEKRGIELGEKRGIKLGEKLGKKRGIKLGEKLGEKRGINQVIMNMLCKNLTDEMIADLANVSIDYVQKVRILAAHNGLAGNN